MAFRGYISRDGWGARPPKNSGSRAPFRLGAGIHYGGPSPQIHGRHDRCITTARAYQRHHMIKNDWRDIGYSFLVCDHGYAFEGRGWWTQVAAHNEPGGISENREYRAFCWLGGEGDTPTPDAIDAFRALIAEGRRLGAGDAIKPHRELMPGHTLCPGAPLVRAIERGELDPEDDMAWLDDPNNRAAFAREIAEQVVWGTWEHRKLRDDEGNEAPRPDGTVAQSGYTVGRLVDLSANYAKAMRALMESGDMRVTADFPEDLVDRLVAAQSAADVKNILDEMSRRLEQ